MSLHLPWTTAGTPASYRAGCRCPACADAYRERAPRQRRGEGRRRASSSHVEVGPRHVSALRVVAAAGPLSSAALAVALDPEHRRGDGFTRAEVAAASSDAAMLCVVLRRAGYVAVVGGGAPEWLVTPAGSDLLARLSRSTTEGAR